MYTNGDRNLKTSEPLMNRWCLQTNGAPYVMHKCLAQSKDPTTSSPCKRWMIDACNNCRADGGPSPITMCYHRIKTAADMRANHKCAPLA